MNHSNPSFRQQYDTVIIGAGPAGIAAAGEAAEAGVSVLVIERDTLTGGILNQCIHDGFGLHRYRESLSGPEYADRETARLQAHLADFRITFMLGTFVYGLKKRQEADSGFILNIMQQGFVGTVQACSLIFAMGCRERTAGAISLPGTRPAGIFTAGTAQRLMNMQNIRVGSKAVIIGSGDIGLIMARRLTLEGAEVAAVTEIMPYPGGLDRNIRQCLNDFNIPLHLSTGVIRVHGKHRVEGITVAPIGSDGKLIREKSRHLPCDTVLLSVGLLPEIELLREVAAEIDPVTHGPIVDQRLMTSIPGIFACGNLLQVHDLVDHVSDEAELAGKEAARYALKEYSMPTERAGISHGTMIRNVVPQQITGPGMVALSLRVSEPQINFRITVTETDAGVRLAERIYDRVSPSEMIMIRVPVEYVAPLEVHGESI